MLSGTENVTNVTSSKSIQPRVSATKPLKPIHLESLVPHNWGHLTEAYQDYKNHFAFARRKEDVVYQLHPWVKCRDYLLDGLIWTRKPSLFTQKVYGFPRIDDVNDNEVELLVYGENNNLLKSIPVLRAFEEELGIKRTILRRVADKTWYVRGDPWWNKTTLHLSAYTTMLRIMEHCLITHWGEMESKVQNSMDELQGNLRRAILALKESGYDVLFPMSESCDSTSIHNGSGIYTFVYSVKHGFDGGYNYAGLKEAYANQPSFV